MIKHQAKTVATMKTAAATGPWGSLRRQASVLLPAASLIASLTAMGCSSSGGAVAGLGGSGIDTTVGGTGGETLGLGGGDGTLGTGGGDGTLGTGGADGTLGTGGADGTLGTGGDGSLGGGVGGGIITAGTGGAGPVVPPAIDGQLAINELMAINVLTSKDEHGVTSPWIEILNPTDSDVPLGGYTVTDDLGAPGKAPIGSGAVAPAHGYLLLWLDGNPAAGPTHVAAALNKNGGAVALARPDGTFIDRLIYGAQEVDFSASREPDGAQTWAIEWHVSPGAANPAAATASPDGPALPDPESVPAAGDLSTRILGYDQMPELALTIAAADVQSLLAAPDTYVQATLTYDGRDYGPVGVHVKGMQSFEPIDHKPSLHINVDKFVDGAAFFGLKDITLNNMHSDFSMMHERIAYWAARQAGVPASRANHALLAVNGQPYGLYANVETVKKHILSRAFGNNTGSLFSATDVDFSAPYIAGYELVTGPDDRTLLSGVASALTAANPDDAIAAAAGFADVDQFTRYWALCAIVAQFDSFPYSDPGDDYFTYADPATGRLEFMPWGIDESFYSAELDVSAGLHSALGLACRASPACFQKFVDNVWDILALLERLNWTAEHDRVAAQIAPYVAADTRKPYADSDVAMYQQDMWYFVSERRQRLTMMLPPPSGAAPAGVMPQQVP